MSEVDDRFVEGLHKGVLRVRACLACGLQQTLSPIACTACGGRSLAWRKTDGRGRVYAVTEIHRAPSPAFEALVPYELVLVDLDGGGRIMAHGEAGLAIGAAVMATVVTAAGVPLVRFVPVQDVR